MYPFLKEPKTDHRFKDNVSFDRVLRLYRFDKKLRILLFNEIEKIEIAFRQTVANVTAQMSGNIFWMTDVVSYSNLADQRIRKAIAKTFHLQAPVLDSWMTVITLTRNSCCHHARMWSKINPINPNDMKNDFKNKLTGILNLFPEIDLRAM